MRLATVVFGVGLALVAALEDGGSRTGMASRPRSTAHFVNVKPRRPGDEIVDPVAAAASATDDDGDDPSWGAALYEEHQRQQREEAEKEERERQEKEKERLAKEERERPEKEERERQEKERLAKEERERQEKENRERQEKEERERQEKEERERQEKEKERLAKEERERQEKEERERQEKEERERQEKEEREQQEKEKERLAKEERERQEKEERERQEKGEREQQEKEERERQEKEKERLAKEERERQEKEDRERQEKEERERQEKEERERQEKENERLAKEERERKEKEERERQEKEERRRQEEESHRQEQLTHSSSIQLSEVLETTSAEDLSLNQSATAVTTPAEIVPRTLASSSNIIEGEELVQDVKRRCDRAVDVKGYMRMPGTRSRYKFFKKPMDWRSAKERCERDGALLAVANSEVEAMALIYLMRMTHFPGNPTHMHVGVSDNEDEGVWRPVDGSNDTFYVRWANNQPEIDNTKQNCMQLYTDLTNVDFNCEGKLSFACEKSVRKKNQKSEKATYSEL